MVGDRKKSGKNKLPGVMLTPCLGAVRGFGRRGIPLVYIDSEPLNIVRHSRYVEQRLKCPNPLRSETGFINALLNYGKHKDGDMVIIPTGDTYIELMSKHKHELEQYYILPIAEYETVKKLQRKKNYYRLLAEMKLPHPGTWFPDNAEELRSMGRQIDFPYIIKPDDSLTFQHMFLEKCFVISSPRELDRAVARLKGKDIEFVIQEIIPGRELYNVSGFYNKQSQPVAVCGWDKIRQYPPDFGSGTCCISKWRPAIVEQVNAFFNAIGYYGIGEIELKRDPRDGVYKMIETNIRTVSQNRLAAACGVDVEYIAYLDAIGEPVTKPPQQPEGVLWVSDFTDVIACLVQLKRREIKIIEVARYLTQKKVHSVTAWDDPLPAVYRLKNMARHLLRLMTNKKK
jgi:predicted ATP-grasp superfamily ATP-dependent carboligase